MTALERTIIALLGIIAFAPSRACPADFPGRGDVYYLWPGRMILPPVSTVEDPPPEPEHDDPAPQCVAANTSCDFPEGADDEGK